MNFGIKFLVLNCMRELQTPTDKLNLFFVASFLAIFEIFTKVLLKHCFSILNYEYFLFASNKMYVLLE